MGPTVVAGGACRDWAVHKNINPRDVDLFVTADSELDFEMKLSSLDIMRGGMPPPRLIGPEDMRYPTGEEGSNNILAVALGHAICDDGYYVPYNVIAKTYDPTDVDRLFQDFDHSLTQFAYDGNAFHASEAAQKTLDTGEIAVYTEVSRTYRRLRELVGRSKSYSRFKFEDKTPKFEKRAMHSIMYFDEAVNLPAPQFFRMQDLRNIVNRIEGINQ